MLNNQTLSDTANELPHLTAKQMKFVENIAAGMGRAEAYKSAYPNARGPSVGPEATRLSANPKVMMWLAAYRKAGLATAVRTFDGHIRELERVKEYAGELGDPKTMLQAEVSIGKAFGFYTSRLEIVHSDPVALIQGIQAISPAVAEALAQHYRLPLPASSAGEADTAANGAQVIEHQPSQQTAP